MLLLRNKLNLENEIINQYGDRARRLIGDGINTRKCINI